MTATQPVTAGLSDRGRVEPYRFDRDGFLRAWEAGVFGSRVELIEGEIWPVVIGDWHGETQGSVVGQLLLVGLRATTSTLPTGESLPDPDCWVHRAGAQPLGILDNRLSTWSPRDVLLVVEVSDETLLADLSTKVRVYGSAGWPVYWVVAPDAVYVHTDPHGQGYRLRREYRSGERVPVPSVEAEIAVDDLIGSH